MEGEDGRDGPTSNMGLAVWCCGVWSFGSQGFLQIQHQ